MRLFAFSYQKRRCPDCVERYADAIYPRAIRLGPGFRTCSKCDRTFEDGTIEWPELTPEQRRSYLSEDRGWFVLFLCVFLGWATLKEPGSGVSLIAVIALLILGRIALSWFLHMLQIPISALRHYRRLRLKNG